MSSIDTQNTFDLTYIVPEENKVLKPLDGKSYFNINHIYNKYTLAEIDFNNYSIRVNPSNIT